jgi:SAM-dependent methyltransferase
MNQTPDLTESRGFWDKNPLLAFELPDPGTKRFLDAFDDIRTDLERHAMHLWEFERHAGERVLDVGCGAPAFLVRNFLRGGAAVTGVDLSGASLALAQRHLEVSGKRGTLCQASAEDLPFADRSFDFVTSSGVLHHAPSTERSIAEVRRVLKPGGRTVISLYFRSFFLRQSVWPATRLALSLLLRDVPGRNRFEQVATADEFVRRWDGNENPIGRCYSRAEARTLFSDFTIERVDTHVFHHRFFKLNTRRLSGFLDWLAPTMIYVTARRPVDTAVR